MIYKNMKIFLDGMGLVLYSNEAMHYVKEGEDFLTNEFLLPEQAAKHIKKGDIVGFNIGTGGEFEIKIREGYPNYEISKQYPISIRLAINVKGNIISIVDFLWLLEWCNDVPEEQQIQVEEGIYHLTILTTKPYSGIWGDNQVIYIFMNRLKQMPELSWNGIPQLL